MKFLLENIVATKPTPNRPNNRRSVRNPDNCMAWRERREAEGWRFVQFWARPAVTEKLDELINVRNAIAPHKPTAKAKDVIEDLILNETT
jgi:hypothetical protein